MLYKNIVDTKLNEKKRKRKVYFIRKTLKNLTFRPGLFIVISSLCVLSIYILLHTHFENRKDRSLKNRPLS